jgi:predicted transcriptional regulator
MLEKAKKLSKHKLNGRNIKTTIKLAESLAIQEKKELTIEHFLKTIEICKSFTKEEIEKISNEGIKKLVSKIGEY